MKKIITIFLLFISTLYANNYQDIILEKVNEVRIENKMKPLKIDDELNKIAILKAKDMAKEEKLSHDSKKYGLTFNIIKQRGIKFRSAAENIARWHETPEFVVDRWLKSKGHRANILNSKYDKTGIGVAQDKAGKNYWVQIFIEEKK